MAASWQPRFSRHTSAKYSRNNLGRTHSMRRHRAGQKHKPNDVFDFPDTSDSSSIGRLGENNKDELYEAFDPPLHSTAIEEEISTHCGSSVPSTPPTPQGKEGGKNSNSSENETSGHESLEITTEKLRRKLQPIPTESENSEDDRRRTIQSGGRVSTSQEAGDAMEHSDTPAEPATLKRTGPLSAKSPEKETQATQRPQKTQRKGKSSPGKRKKLRSKATAGSDPSESMHIWCLEGKRISDIMELDIVLSAFEKTILEYRRRIESRSCKEAINHFFCNIKGELIRMLIEVQMLKTLKRKNTQIISSMEKKRQRLIEVQEELLRLEPQLKQVQTKYDELKERKSSLKNSVHFLSNLKQLYQDYSDIRGKEPKEKEIYDSSSLPALLFKARTILGAKTHLQTINYQLGKLLDQNGEAQSAESRDTTLPPESALL